LEGGGGVEQHSGAVLPLGRTRRLASRLSALGDRFRRRIEEYRRHPNPWVRRSLAGLLVVGGMLGFLPILGFWMIPLGLYLVSDDIPPLRRARRRLAVRFARWRGR